MKFAVFNHFNNNTDNMQKFKNAAGGSTVYSMSNKARFSNSGLCIFSMPKYWSPEQKLDVVRKLNDGLKAEFGRALSAALLPSSDCTTGRHEPFFAGVVAIDPAIKKMTTARHYQMPGADITVDTWEEKFEDVVVAALDVQDSDIQETTGEGWEEREKRMNAFYEGIQEELGLG